MKKSLLLLMILPIIGFVQESVNESIKESGLSVGAKYSFNKVNRC